MKKRTILCVSLGALCSVLLGFSSMSVASQHSVHKIHHNIKHDVVLLNYATADQLASLKGLGKKRAQSVVSYREAHGPFKTINDLVSVKGIGGRLLEKMIKNNPGRMRLNK